MITEKYSVLSEVEDNDPFIHDTTFSYDNITKEIINDSEDLEREFNNDFILNENIKNKIVDVTRETCVKYISDVVDFINNSNKYLYDYKMIDYWNGEIFEKRSNFENVVKIIYTSDFLNIWNLNKIIDSNEIYQGEIPTIDSFTETFLEFIHSVELGCYNTSFIYMERSNDIDTYNRFIINNNVIMMYTTRYIKSDINVDMNDKLNYVYHEEGNYFSMSSDEDYILDEIMDIIYRDGGFFANNNQLEYSDDSYDDDSFLFNNLSK